MHTLRVIFIEALSLAYKCVQIRVTLIIKKTFNKESTNQVERSNATLLYLLFTILFYLLFLQFYMSLAMLR